MLIELPDGNWIDPKAVTGVRVMDDVDHGPRVAIDTLGRPALHYFTFDDADAARGWVKQFGTDCNAALAAASNHSTGRSSDRWFSDLASRQLYRPIGLERKN